MLKYIKNNKKLRLATITITIVLELFIIRYMTTILFGFIGALILSGFVNMWNTLLIGGLLVLILLILIFIGIVYLVYLFNND